MIHNQYSYFMSPEPAKSVCGPVVMNENETCCVSYSRW